MPERSAPVAKQALPSARSSGATPKVRRRYALGTATFVYIGITLLIALGAFNSQNNLLFWTFGFAMAALLVSGLISGSMLMGVEIVRVSIAEAQVGEFIRIRYRVHNRNRLVPVFALLISEEGLIPPGRRFFKFLRGRRRDDLSALPVMTVPIAFVAQLGAGETVHVEAIALAKRRGRVMFTSIIAHSSFPFGLMRKILHISQGGTTVIRPAVIHPPTGLLKHGSSTGLSGAVSRRPGPGEEFFSLREYVPGDGIRSIAWKASARRGSLLVRQNAMPSPGRLWIVLRLRSTVGSTIEDEHAISLAAGVAHQAEKHGMEYGLATPLTRTLIHPRHGPIHLARLMTELGMLELGPDDGRGRNSAFPAPASGLHGLCVVVHAGLIDPTFRPTAGNQFVTHISGSSPMVAGSDQPGEAAA
jgi:uncharacterized protein (DUF58 family)